MECFTPDNTEGYTAEQLAVLNKEYNRRIEVHRAAGESVEEEDNKTLTDHVAERVLADFDSGIMPEQAWFAVKAWFDQQNPPDENIAWVGFE